MLLQLILLLAASCYADEEETFDPKSINGRLVNIKDANWMASYGGHCGGVLVDYQWVLTSAACGNEEFVKIKSETLNVRVGDIVEVGKRIVHPKFDPVKYKYNYQLVKLKYALPRNDPNVGIIRLGTIDIVQVPGRRVTMFGYGETIENIPNHGTLLSITMPIYERENCTNIYAKAKFPQVVDGTMFCYGYESGGRGGCTIDRGGPVVFNNKLIGIYSFSKGCGRQGFFDVAGSVAEVTDWIQSTIKSNSRRESDDGAKECNC